MKIALFHNLPSGGAKRHTFEQVRELNRRGHQITEFAPDTADQNYCSFSPYMVSQRIYPLNQRTTEIRRIPFLTPYINTWRGLSLLRAVDRLNWQIANEINVADFEIVLVKDCQFIGNPYVLKYLNTPALYQCHHVQREWRPNDKESRELKISTINSIKNIYYAPAKKIYNQRVRLDDVKNIQYATRIITNSKFSVAAIDKYYRVHSQFIYPGISTDCFKPLDIEKQNFVLCVGSINYEKGHRFLIKAIGQLPEFNRPALFIAANTREPMEEEIIRTLAVQNNVKLIIEKIFDDLKLTQVYNQALAFIYAPIQEALGMAPLEAMACGTPVVAVAEGGVKETILDGRNGWLVRRDAKEFAERIQILLADKKLRMKMGKEGIAAVRQNWTWEHAVDRLEEEIALTIKTVANPNAIKNTGSNESG